MIQNQLIINLDESKIIIFVVTLPYIIHNTDQRNFSSASNMCPSSELVD